MSAQRTTVMASNKLVTYNAEALTASVSCVMAKIDVDSPLTDSVTHNVPSVLQPVRSTLFVSPLVPTGAMFNASPSR